MAEFAIDPATGQATITFLRGAQVARAGTLNGNVVHYDGLGNVVDYVVASPRGSSGIDLNGLPDHDNLKSYLTQRNGKRNGDSTRYSR